MTSWGLPHGSSFTPFSIAIDANAQYLYVADTTNNQVEKFDLNGGLISQFGGGPTSFNGPSGITTDSNGDIFVSDSGNNRVMKFNPSGALDITWGTNGVVQGFNLPRGLSVDGSGNLYAADYNNNRVVKFDINGNSVNSFGPSGSANGKFTNPSDVKINLSSGYIYIADSGNNRVQVFDQNENYLSQFGGIGSGQGDFFHPQALYIDENGDVYVADTGNNRWQEFNSSNTMTAGWTVPGGPWGGVLDGNGYFYSVGVNVVEKYSPPITYEITPNPVHAGQNPAFIFNLASAFNYSIDVKSVAQEAALFHYSGQGTAGNNQILWDVTNVGNGVYLATFTSGNTQVQSTITVAK